MKDYSGTESYIVSQHLMDSVNVSIALSRPLLVKGEPGTGKTLLAHSIAEGIKKEIIVWNIKSTTKAKDGLYVYDTVQRLNDARFGEGNVSDIKRYIKLGKLGQSFTTDKQVVLLIDEIDKADLEFPNDLLNEMDVMSFHIPETDETITAKNRPIVIITSNSEKELPDAFLRRCVFHYIEFPDDELMERIIRVHFPNIERDLMDAVIARFYWIRSLNRLRKKPSTSELIDWVQALIVGGIDPDRVEAEIPFLGTLMKKNEDYITVERHKDYDKSYQGYRQRNGRGA
ncbi:MAG: MoxR family ATPase [Deltaproteobacteria bacterium]|uniref:MoxR family ATPase n=1 Tax=Candidatus Zymogenus saltonus TaxID=2844893 RepID=A0A9D8KHV0_9DELT|nr:MoxR family ATPase [Candidatus Zymogenus saltonus]